MLIEQAVFTSASTDVAAGYHLVASSPGIDEVDAREISVWSPSHDSLCELPSPAASSVNFYRLSSGNYCISKTQLAGGEYSGRGLRTYTNCLVVPAEILLRFANNPFALLRAAWAKGLLKVHESAPPQLVPFQLAGRSALVDEGMLVELAERLGATRLAQIVQAIIKQRSLMIVGAERPDATMAGLINFFPASCRNEITFTTGLRNSARRPFMVHFAPHDPAEVRRLARQPGVTLIDLTLPINRRGDSHDLIETGWAAFIAQAAASDQLSLVVEQLLARPDGLHLGDLDALGEHLQRELHHRTDRAEQSELLDHVIGEAIRRDVMDEELLKRDATIAGETPTETGRDTNFDTTQLNSASYDPAQFDLTHFDEGLFFNHLPDGSDAYPQPSQSVPRGDQRSDNRALQRLRDSHTFRSAHAPHTNGKQSTRSVGLEKHGCPAPAVTLAPYCPKLVEKLEKLDDVIYDAINGDARATDEATRIWPELLLELGPAQIDESREQYLRYSLNIWEHCLDEGLTNADRAVSALHVLCLLFNDE